MITNVYHDETFDDGQYLPIKNWFSSNEKNKQNIDKYDSWTNLTSSTEDFTKTWYHKNTQPKLYKRTAYNIRQPIW
jgi:hypothetical protein